MIRQSVNACRVHGMPNTSCMMSELCLAQREDCGVAKNARQVFHRGESLYRSGDDFKALYVLYSGSAKSLILSEDGDQQITEFYMPGDILGVEGFDIGQHSCSVEFLETSSACCIALPQLDKALGESAELRRSLLKSMSHSLNNEHAMLFNVCQLSAERRLANFIISLSERFQSRGFSAFNFYLSMSRNDIANYLGMKIETVSRLLTRLQQRNVIRVNRRQIQITDLERLRDCSDTELENNRAVRTQQCQQVEFNTMTQFFSGEARSSLD